MPIATAWDSRFRVGDAGTRCGNPNAEGSARAAWYLGRMAATPPPEYNQVLLLRLGRTSPEVFPLLALRCFSARGVPRRADSREASTAFSTPSATTRARNSILGVEFSANGRRRRGGRPVAPSSATDANPRKLDGNRRCYARRRPNVQTTTATVPAPTASATATATSIANIVGTSMGTSAGRSVGFIP
jgi:hypothetical protein